LVYGLVVGGFALVTGGVISLALASRVQNDIDDAPTTTAAELGALVDLESKGRFRYRLSYALLGAGAVSLAAGVTLGLLGRSDRRVTVAPTGSGVVAAVGGEF